MEIRCIIVDDEPPAQRVLESYIKEIPSLKLEAKCKNALEAMAILLQRNIDILFLDINMPKMNGLDFLKTLKNPPVVIITTAYRDYAVESFELDVLDYLKKPFSLDRFVKAVNKAMVKLNVTSPAMSIATESQSFDSNSIFVKEDKIIYQISLNDILFIEAVGDYIKIITSSKVYITKQTMKKMEANLPAGRFIRIHKSFIISISKVDKIDGSLIHIGPNRIPISQTFQKSFWDLISAKR